MADGIDINTDHLDDFSAKVNKSTTDDLEQGYYGTEYQIGWGPTFGYKTQSQAVLAAQQKLAETTKAATANVQNYITAAQLFAQAAKEIAADMRRSDGSAADMLKSNHKVLQALDTAQQAITKQQQADAAAAAAQQQQRELRRAE